MPPKSYAKIARSVPAPAPRRVPMTESELSRVLAEVPTSWGEIACVGDPLPVQRRRSPLAAPAPVLRADWTDFYAQPWAEKVELRGSDYLDLSDLTEDAYEAAMTWIYAMGWSISSYENGMADETRLWVVCQPDTLPPRVWVRPNRFEGAAQLLGGTAETAPVPVARARIVIPRFCRAGPDCLLKDTTCNFCHADTIACLDEPCTFGEKCSAEKRLTCIRTHPGEPHYEGRCIHAPWAAERAAKAAAEAEAEAEAAAEATAEAEARAAVRARAAALVEPVPEPQAAGPSWDDEDYVTPEVTVVSVTPEELEREAWNKGHRRAQTA